MKSEADKEVFNLFSHLVPPGAASAPLFANTPEGARRRQGIVTDLRFDLPPGLGSDHGACRTQLGEVKFIHHCPSRYRNSDLDPRGH